MGWEAIAILHREGRKHWNGGGHHAVWACNVEHGGHPTQKPLKLLMDWVTKFTDPGELAKMWILRKLLHPMDELAAIEFLLDKMKDTKSNSEFFEAMKR